MFCSYAPTHTTHPLIVSRARACPISCSCTRSSSLPPFSSLPPLSSTCSGTYRSFSLQMKRSAFCSTQHDRMDVIPKSAKAQNWMPSMASSIPALEPVAYAPRRPCGVARDAVPNQSWLNNAAALKPLFPNRARASAHAGTGIGCRNGEGAIQRQPARQHLWAAFYPDDPPLDDGSKAVRQKTSFDMPILQNFSIHRNIRMKQFTVEL